MRMSVVGTRIKRFVRIRVDSWLKMKGACEIIKRSHRTHGTHGKWLLQKEKSVVSVISV